ncbi:MAG TPA: nuclear transport factor 2 family protein [Chryseolinea sp.]
MTTKELLDSYYKGFAKKQGWEATIADDFKFIGGDMTKTEPIVGKQAYIDIIKRFSALFTDMRPKEIFTSEDGAFVLANYDYVFPNGKSINANVAELWSVKNGQLDALTIFFDTEGFQKFLPG